MSEHRLVRKEYMQEIAVLSAFACEDYMAYSTDFVERHLGDPGNVSSVAESLVAQDYMERETLGGSVLYSITPSGVDYLRRVVQNG